MTSRLATSVNAKVISSQIKREYLEPVLGQVIVPENYNFGGISGAPMLYVLMTGGLFAGLDCRAHRDRR